MKDFLDIGEKVDLNQDGTLKVGEETTEETIKETKAEETVDTKTEEKKETTKTDTSADADKADAEKKDDVPAFSFDSFKNYSKETLEKEFETEDDFKSYIKKADEYDELKKQVGDLSQEKAELFSLASKGLSGRDWFANDDEFIRQQFLKNNGDKFSEAALSVLSNLSPEKVTKLDPLEAIKVNLMIENPDLEKSEVDELVSEQYNPDGDEEWSPASKAKMKVAANTAKKSLKSLYKDIEIPEKVDWSAKRTELKNVWDDPLSKTIDGIDKLQLTEDLSFDVTPEMKNGLKDAIMNELLISQTKPSEQVLGEIAGKTRSYLLESQFDKIMKVAIDHADERAKEKYRKEVHNDTDVNNDTRTKEGETEVLEGKALLNMF